MNMVTLVRDNVEEGIKSKGITKKQVADALFSEYMTPESRKVKFLRYLRVGKAPEEYVIRMGEILDRNPLYLEGKESLVYCTAVSPRTGKRVPVYNTYSIYLQHSVDWKKVMKEWLALCGKDSTHYSEKQRYELYCNMVNLSQDFFNNNAPEGEEVEQDGKHSKERK